MKRIVLTFVVSLFALSSVFAEEMFLSLTRYDENIEKLPTNVKIISEKDIEEKHVETLGELLSDEAGLFYKTNGTVGDMPTVFMRGAASSARTLVLIDGRRANLTDSGAANFYDIPASMIEKVEIIRGAGSAIYGTGAFGGVINIITKKAKEDSPAANFGFSYGSNKTANPYAVFSFYNENYSALLGANVYQTDGYRPNSNYNGTNFLFNGSVKITKNQSLSISANKYEADMGFPGSTIFNDPGQRKDDNNYVKVDYKIDFEENVFLNLSAYSSQYKTINDNRAFAASYQDHSRFTNDAVGGQVDFVYNKLTIGTEFREDKFESSNLDGGTYTPIPLKSRSNFAVYSQWMGELGKFILIPSARFDHNSNFGDVWTPSLSTVYNITNSLKISANFGKVWRAPTFMDLYYPNYSDPNLKPEEGVSSDLGIEVVVTNSIKLSATGYYMQTDKLIVSNGNYIPANIDKSKQYGAEFEAGYIITSWLNSKINYTFLKTEFMDGAYSGGGHELPYSPNHTVSYNLTLKLFEKFSLSAVVSYRDKYYDNAANTVKINGFVTLDLTAGYKLNNSFSFWVKGFNVADADYSIVDGYPMPGATVYAGLDIKLWK
jgi:outer membrane cobalamin receptor